MNIDIALALILLFAGGVEIYFILKMKSDLDDINDTITQQTLAIDKLLENNVLITPKALNELPYIKSNSDIIRGAKRYSYKKSSLTEKRK